MILRYLSNGLDLFSKKSMCAQIVFGVERSGKFFGFDGFAAAGGVDEFTVADVEADMGIFVRAQQRQNHQNRKTFHPVLRQKLFGRTYLFY